MSGWKPTGTPSGLAQATHMKWFKLEHYVLAASSYTERT